MVADPSVLAAPRGTANVSQSDAARDVSKEIFYIDPADFPVTNLLTGYNAVPGLPIRGKETKNKKFEWKESQNQPVWDKVTVTAAAAATVLTVANPKYYVAGDIWWNIRTGERMRVTTTPAAGATTVTFTRAAGETAAAVINVNDEIRKLADAQEEGGTSPASTSVLGDWKYNLIQEMITPVEITDIQAATAMETGVMDEAEELKLKATAHKRKMEAAFLFGERYQATGTTHEITATRGITRLIESGTGLVDDAQGNLTEDEWDEFNRNLFYYGSDQKVAFCGGLAIKVINGFAKNRLQVAQGAKEYGLNISKYVTGFGELWIVPHKMLSMKDPATKSDLATWIIGVDLKHIQYRWMIENQNLHENIQAKNSRTKLHEYRTYAGIQFVLADAHRMMKNVLQ